MTTLAATPTPLIDAPNPFDDSPLIRAWLSTLTPKFNPHVIAPQTTPWMIAPQRICRGLLSLSVLQPIGNNASWWTPWNNPACQHLMNLMQTQWPDQWDYARFHVLGGAERQADYHHLQKTLTDAGYTVYRQAAPPVHGVSDITSMDDWYARLQPNTRKDVQAKCRRAERQASITFDTPFAQRPSAHELIPYFDTYCREHIAYWGKKHASFLNDPREQAFFAEWACHLAAQDDLITPVYTWNDEPIFWNFAFQAPTHASHRTLYWFQDCQKAEHAYHKLAPGVTRFDAQIRWGLAHGYTTQLYGVGTSEWVIRCSPDHWPMELWWVVPPHRPLVQALVSQQVTLHQRLIAEVHERIQSFWPQWQPTLPTVHK